MAFGNLTLDFNSLKKIPIRDRATLAGSSFASEIFGNLTPSQIAALFPDYYKKQINAMAGESSGFGAAALSTVKSNGSGGGVSAGATGGGTGGGSTTAVPAGPPPRPEVIDGILKDAGISVESSSSVDGNFTAKERATLDFVAQREGATNPNVVFGGTRYESQLGLDKVPLTERSVADVINNIMPQLRSLSKADGYGVLNGRVVGTSAVGTGQMVESTLKANLRHLGIPESEWGKIKFDKKLQERLTLANFETSGIGDPNNPKSWNYDRLAQQYESIKKRAITAEEIAKIDSATDSIQTGQLGGTEPVDTSTPGSDTAIRPLRNDGSKFDPLVLDNLDPRVKDFYMNKATEYEKKALEKAITKLGIDGVNQTTAKYPTANPAMVNTKIMGESDRFSVIKGDIADVDPRLTNLLKDASRDLPAGYTVRAISGKDARSTGTKNHPGGLAVDVQIYNDKGELLKYDGNSPDWKEYEKLYRSVYIRGQDLYPDQKFIWGGAWQSKAAGNGDPMHYQIVNPNVVGSSQTSGRYSFERGLDPNHDFARNTPNNQLTAEERAYYDESIRAKIIAEKQTLTNPNVTAEPITAATAPVTDTPKVDASGSDVGTMNLKQPEATPVPAPVPNETDTAPKMKLGGEANLVDEPLSVVNKQTGEEQLSFNGNEEVNIKDGRAEVKNEYKKATEETQQKTDTGPALEKAATPEAEKPKNQMRMIGTNKPPTNPWSQQMADNYSPYSPSASRAFNQIKPDRHWERGNQSIDA